MKYKIEYIENPNDFLNRNLDSKLISWDTETNSLNPFIENFVVKCITMSFDGITGYYLPFDRINKRLLSKFFSNKYQIFSEGKYDCKALLVNGVKGVKVDEDTALLYHCLNTSRIKNGLKSLSWLIGFGGYEEELENYKKKYKISDYTKIPENILIKYSTLDSIITYRLYEHAKKNLIPKQKEVYKVYKEVFIPVIQVFIDMEMEGISIDIDYLNRLNDEYLKKEEAVAKSIKKIIGKDFNLNSNEVLGKILEEFGLPDLGRVKKGIYRTGVDILQQWEKQGYDIANLILKLREIKKLKESFIGSTLDSNRKGLSKHICADRKVHANYGVAKTGPMRQSCQNPNIQQIPRNKDVRKLFKLPEDFLFVDFDISGFHLRLIAIESFDPEMVSLFNSNYDDMHSLTAQTVFCRDMEFKDFLKNKKQNPYKNYRDRSKAINFAFAYNSSYYTLVPIIELEWSDKQKEDYIKKNISFYDYSESKEKVICKDIKNKFLNRYKKIKSYSDAQIHRAYNQGYIDCSWGGRRHLIEMNFNYRKESYLTEFQKKVISHLENVATNTNILTMEAIYMDKCMIAINNELKNRNYKSKIVLMVHDSVCLKVFKPELKEVYKLVMNILENYVDYVVPIKAECKVGDIWGFGEEVTEEDLDKFV